MVQTTRKRFPVFVFCFVFLVVLALCERGFTFAWPPPSPFAPSNTGIHFSQRAYNKYHHHLPGCPPGLSAFHSWTVARAVSSFISLKTETRKIDVFCSESSPFLLCAVKIIQTISKSEIWRGPICQNISVHNTVLQVQPSTSSCKQKNKKKKKANLCCIQATRNAAERRVRLRHFHSGSAADSRLDECEKEVRRESQTPMDQWPGNLWHQTMEQKTASVFFPGEFPSQLKAHCGDLDPP